MNHEFNPPAEMLRRLAYVIYLALLAGTAVSAIIALAQARSDQFLVATLLALLATALKHFGKRHLHFERLFNSFPYGNKADDIPLKLRQDLKKLLEESNAPGLTWQERQNLRSRLADLILKEPRLLAIDRSRILAIHPTITAKVENPRSNSRQSSKTKE